jgi:hypothetical protein
MNSPSLKSASCESILLHARGATRGLSRRPKGFFCIREVNYLLFWGSKEPEFRVRTPSIQTHLLQLYDPPAPFLVRLGVIDISEPDPADQRLFRPTRSIIADGDPSCLLCLWCPVCTLLAPQKISFEVSIASDP